MGGRRRSVRVGRGAVVGALGLVVVLLFGALPAVAASPAFQRAQPRIVIGPAVSTATVYWNGENVSGASSAGTAVAINKGQTVPVLFGFIEKAPGLVRQASLQLTYLGVVLTTATAGAHPAVGPLDYATAQINWSFGELSNALQGVFEFKASLQNATGVALWNETFFVFAKTPYLLESGAVVVLLLLVLVEAYWIAASIRDARKGARPPPPAPWSPPASSSGAGPPASGTSPPSDSSPGSAPPASGGST
jgi:hypothetical protein